MIAQHTAPPLVGWSKGNVHGTMRINVSDLVVVVNRIDLGYKVPRGTTVNTPNLNKLFMRALEIHYRAS